MKYRIAVSAVLAEKTIQVPLRLALVGMVETSQRQECTHAAVSARVCDFSVPGFWDPLCQASMRPGAIDVRHVLIEHPPQVALAED